MASPPSKQPSFERQQLLRLLAAFLIAVVATTLAAVGMIYYSARLVDGVVLQQETKQVSRRIDSTLLKMHDDVQSAAVWNEAHANSLALNRKWMHLNFGKYFSDYMNYPVTVTFAPDGAVTYASRNGRVVSAAHEASFITAVSPLLQAVRAESATRNRGAKGHRAFGFAAHVTREGIVLVSGAPYFVEVSNIVPEDAEHRDANQDDPILATGQRVSSLPPQLAQDLGLFRPQIVLGAAVAKGPAVALTAPDGAVIGRISWVASRPGGKLLLNAAPALLVLAGVILAALLFGMVRVHRLFRALAHNEEALEFSRREAEEANAAKSRFLANMSHELRTPLNGIIAISEMLHRQQTDSRGREMTRTVVASGRMLERVLNDILDVSKIEAIQMNFENVPFDLEELLVDVTTLHRATATAKGLSLVLDVQPGAAGTYDGDQIRISQILSNLLSNAVKFTDHGGVKITARRSARGLRLSVSDTGMGFDRKTADRLFRRFEQGDASVSRRHGGTGLGLWISRALVRAMGGQILMRSVVGKGSLFSVFLPLEKRSEGSAHERAGPVDADVAADDAHAPLRVLVAEDHEVNRRVIVMILETLGASITMVGDGEQAIEAFNQADFDIILMDTQMPVMDGLTATRKIRALEAARGSARTPIIAVTANAMSADRALSLEAGSDLHLTKPIRPTALIEALMSLLAPENS